MGSLGIHVAWPVLALVVAVLAPAGANGASLFYVDPRLSTATLSGEVTIDLGPSSTVVLPLASQAGSVPGVVAGTLADGAPSDGLSASIGGQILPDLEPPFCPPGFECVGFERRATLLSFAPSGEWLRGEPASPDSAAPAAFAAWFSDETGALSGAVALRDLALSISYLAQLQPGPGGSATFAGVQDFWTEGGMIDAALSFADFRVGLPDGVRVGNVVTSSLERLGDGRQQLTIPLDLALVFDPDDFGGGLPLTADLRLGGRIVAYDAPLSTPEPSAAAVLLGVLTIEWLRRKLR